jgi:CRP-like cAMP-binding protein
MPINTEVLKTFPYFSGLSQAELDAAHLRMQERKVDRGEIIIYDGEPAEALYFVLSGAVKVFKTSTDGKEQILNIVQPGQTFNDSPVFNNTPNEADAQAIVPTVLYELRKGELNALLKDYPQVAINAIKVLAGQAHQLVSLVEDLSFKHVIGRVAKILLEHAGDNATPGLKLTQQDMAALAGTAREVIGRSLKSLESEGVVRFERHRIIITNKDALRTLVDSKV